MNYRQHMKHWKNHHKDRYLQQCSGPVHEPADNDCTGCVCEIEKMSFIRLMNMVKHDDFPVYVKQGSGGIWSFTIDRDCFGNKIESMDDMRQFFDECVL